MITREIVDGLVWFRVLLLGDVMNIYNEYQFKYQYTYIIIRFILYLIKKFYNHIVTLLLSLK